MRARLFSISLVLLISLGINPGRGVRATTRPSADSFDSDGISDLVIGAPYEVVSVFPDDFDNAGAIHVLFGEHPGGLSGTGDLYWDQSTSGIPDIPEEHDKFGLAVAIGNFNCDGNDDLAVGVPGQAVLDHLGVNQPYAGIVHVFYGYSDGISLVGDQVWSQGVGAIGSNPESGDNFGDTLATADFNGDGCDDLAVGVPDEDWYEDQSGIVQIIYGSQSGLTDAGTDLFRQGYNGLLESEEAYDNFGEALAGGDFNGDGYDDLAIGVPNEDFGGDYDWYQGVVHIIYGSQGGLTTNDNYLLHQDVDGMDDVVENDDKFGSALVSGKFNGDPYDDLAIGVPGEGNSYDLFHGAVHIVFGWPFGLWPFGSIYIDKAELGYSNDVSAYFGTALASSDINRDGYADLAIGAPYDSYGSADGGIVYVVYGERILSSPYDFERVIQGLNDIVDSIESGDRFGYKLAMGDFNGDLYGDLAVGVPREDPGNPEITDAGAVNVIYGTGSGLTGDDNQFWYQGFNGLQGTAEAGDLFGLSLAARPFSVEFIYLPLVIN